MVSDVRINWPRFTKKLIFALLGALVVLDLALAWLYVHALTHPGCPEAKPPSPDLPEPQVYALPTYDDLTLEAWYYPSRNGAAVVAMGGLDGSTGTPLPHIATLIEAGYGVLQIATRACAGGRSR